LQFRLVRHAKLHTRCVEAAFRSGVNILRHSEHRLRVGIERTLDKPGVDGRVFGVSGDKPGG
jgi:hypothetical protein